MTFAAIKNLETHGELKKTYEFEGIIEWFAKDLLALAINQTQLRVIVVASDA